MKIFTKKTMISLLASFVMISFSIASYAQENMLNNPGFEEWADGKPVNWFGSKTNITAVNIVQSSDANTGSSACQLINIDSGHKRFTSESLAVEGGQTYTVKFWLRGSGDVRTGFWDGQGTDGGNYVYNDYVKAGNAWTQYVQTVTAPATVTNAELIFSLRNTTGDNILLDDVEFLGSGGPPALIVDFKADQTVASVGTTIKFTDLSTGNPIQWSWSVTGPQDFESNEQNPSFTFTEAGTYDVKLIASNEEASGEKEEVGYIMIGDFIFFQNWNDGDWHGWTEVSVEGDQKWGWNDKYGIDDTPCVRMSGYDQASVANEDWLLSPEFALAAGHKSVLSFQNAKSSHDGPDLEAYFTTNYTGDVKTTTWERLSFTLCTGGYTWTHSGNISLTQYTGTKCRVAFKYTSTNAASCIWELDDIVLTKDGGTAIGEVETLEFNIYPNPSTGVFYVDAKSEVNIKIYSISGRLIREFDANEKTQIDMNADAKGIYFVQVANQNGAKTVRKLIVQ